MGNGLNLSSNIILALPKESQASAAALPGGRGVQGWGMTAKRVHYTGRVQGVGFRYTVRQLAAGYEVSGWVKNLTDGRVELLVISRNREELEAFLAELRDNSAVAHYIKEVEEQAVVPVPAGVTGFSIARE